MNVNILLAEKVRIDSVFLRIGAHPGQRRGHRLLHHLAQMSGGGELLSATHPAGFDENDVATHRRPH